MARIRANKAEQWRRNENIRGILKKHGRSRSSIRHFMETYPQVYALTERQSRLFDYFLGRGGTPREAWQLSRGSMRGGKRTLELVRNKVRSVEAKLDPNVHGVSELPWEYVKTLVNMHYRPPKVRGRILFPLEDARAQESLDKLMPGLKPKGRLRLHRSSNLLQKSLACLDTGIAPKDRILVKGSAHGIRQMRAEVRHGLDRELLGKAVAASKGDGAQARLRQRIVDIMLERPEASVHDEWLAGTLMKEGYSNGQVGKALDALRGRGILSPNKKTIYGRDYLSISRRFRTSEARAKLDYLNRKISLERHGVSEFPEERLWGVVGMQTSEVKKKTVSILAPLEEAHATAQLDKLLGKHIKGWKSNKSLKRVGRVTLLDRTKACIDKDIVPTANILTHYSLNDIKTGNLPDGIVRPLRTHIDVRTALWKIAEAAGESPAGRNVRDVTIRMAVDAHSPELPPSTDGVVDATFRNVDGVLYYLLKNPKANTGTFMEHSVSKVPADFVKGGVVRTLGGARLRPIRGGVKIRYE